jgi:hypothetical protein
MATIHARMSEWLGAPVRRFKIIHDFGSGSWNNIHDPFYGIETKTFQDRLHYRERAVFYKYGKRGFIAYSCNGDDDDEEEATASLVALATTNGLPLLQCRNRASREDFVLDGFSLHRDVATFVKLASNKYPMCCHNHKTLSKLATMKKRGQAPSDAPLMFFDILDDTSNERMHMSFKDMPYGEMYKATLSGLRSGSVRCVPAASTVGCSAPGTDAIKTCNKRKRL